MKQKIIILLSLILAGNTIFAQKVYKHMPKAKISSAVIYLTGAEINRSTKINLKAGRNELTFENISSKLNTKSIRVTLDEGVELLSISTKMNYLTKVEELPRIKQLRDSLQIVSRRIKNFADLTDAYNIEKQMLLANTSIGGEDNGVAIAELQLASNFYRTKIIEINTKLSDIQFQTFDLNKKQQKLQNELNELNAQSNYSRSEIIILLSAKNAGSTNIKLKYLVNDAGWSPAYDIKAEDTDKPVVLVYRAKVFNNTGIDWFNMDITLSTADHTLNITKPDIQPWSLTYYSYTYNNISSGEGYTQNAFVPNQEVTWDYEEQVQSNVTGTELDNYAKATVPELNAEFEIDRKYTIPSDDKPYLVDVDKHELPATFKHFAVTKLDKDVFLLARITGWEDLNLVDGPANIYYAGTYLGQSFINTRNVKDTLDLPLGRDGKVLVTRTKLKDYSKTQFVGNKRKETLTYELVAKNNRKSAIDIDILDQIPISQTDEIEVKVLEISDAKYNEETGELKWHYRLQAGESKKIRLSFSIKYPKNKKVQINKQKSRNVRYF